MKGRQKTAKNIFIKIISKSARCFDPLEVIFRLINIVQTYILHWHVYIRCERKCSEVSMRLSSHQSNLTYHTYAALHYDT